MTRASRMSDAPASKPPMSALPPTAAQTAPSRAPDAADLALAKVATPWLGIPHSAANTELAQALAAWLQARGIY